MSRSTGLLSRATAVLLSLLVVAVAVPKPAPARPDPRPNIVVILTDDQSYESLPHDPPVMPYLQGRLEDPSDHWVSFPNAFLNTPLCCPSRATLLTGQYSHHTGVRRNEDGHLLDESNTLATWLHDAGYWTGLVGKYLNHYPFQRGPYVPPGWDRWAARASGHYYDYRLVEGAWPAFYGDTPGVYSTDVLAGLSVDFIRSAPRDRPFFLEFAPMAPHSPRIPAPRDGNAYEGLPIQEPPSDGEPDVSDKPAWIASRPEPTASRLVHLDEARRREYETLLGVDDAVRQIVDALRERGILGNTVILYYTDNGFSFGEHRWVGKRCAYEECIRTPFLVRYPGAAPHSDDHLVSNVDVAPTIAGLAGVVPRRPIDGRSLVPLLAGLAPPSWRAGVLIEYVGDGMVPPWWGVRTKNFEYDALATGERELYDLAGAAGPPDPYELQNRVADPAYAKVRGRLATLLADLRAT